MDKQLLLTKDEILTFKSLDATVSSSYKPMEEKLDCYETPRQLTMRYSLADFSAVPKMKDLAMKLQKGDLSFSIDDIPEEAQKEVYFVLGARGVGVLIQSLLPGANAEELEAVAMLSQIRHKLLEINSTAVHH